jgi:transcriptional antiterminator NusG
MSDEKKWYVLRVISGKERKTKEYIDLEVSRSNWSEIISQVMVPMEKIYKIKNGKKVASERNIYPGYILLEADEKRFTPEMMQTIRNVSNVINFLGDNRPQALRQSEVNRILGKVDDMQMDDSRVLDPYHVGETVKIIDGPFNDFLGLVEEVNEEKKKLKVTVKIFGRKTPVELNFVQVEKQQ